MTKADSWKLHIQKLKKKKRQGERRNICVHNESSSEQCCFINAGSILMAFWGFIFSGLGDILGESAASSRPSGLGGFALSLPTCFQYPTALTHFLACARARFCLGLDRAPAPAPRGRQGRRKRGRGGERNGAASERDGTNQKQMLAHVWFSISKLSRDRLFPAIPFIFQPHFGLCTVTLYSPGEDQHTAAAWLNSPPQSVKNSDLWWSTRMLTHLESPQ